MSANNRQVAGNHYSAPMQHWDFVVANDLNYFEGQITKYVTRCRKKGQTVQDLEKAKHFLEKYIEIQKGAAEQVEEDRFQVELGISRRREGAA